MPNSLSTGTDQLLLQLFVVFVTAKLLGEFFERLTLPSVPGEILAGIVLGPFALGWVPNSDTLGSIAQIGAIFILFSAGLETNPRELVRVSRKALLVSVIGVLAPFCPRLCLYEVPRRADVGSGFCGCRHGCDQRRYHRESPG